MQDEPGSKERIKREAMRLLVEHGADAVSMRDIADAVGLKASSLFSHFRSREVPIGELFFDSRVEYGRRSAQVAATRGRFARKLEAVAHESCALHAESDLLPNFSLLTQRGSPRHVAPDERNPVKINCGAIAAAMQAGETPAGNPMLVTGALIGAIMRAVTFKLYGRLDLGLADLADEIVVLRLKLVACSQASPHSAAAKSGPTSGCARADACSKAPCVTGACSVPCA